ncbi:MAG: Do family serine endopeptidase [Bacteroidales bacterium]|jgi:serine protease Do|nr:Do family serine endopeptidase [Bacteroidales bacterium]
MIKTRTLIGNIAIAFLSALIAVIVYSNFFHNKIINKPNAVLQKQHTISLLDDSNLVNYTQNPRTKTSQVFDFTVAAEKSINAVVHVTSTYNLQNEDYYSNPITEWLFGEAQRQPSVSFGSGVIISEDGYIVTNFHVVEKSSEIQIVLNDKRTFKAELIGKDAGTDLAVLKVESSNLPNISFGNSDILKVGEWVLAVGNPFNLTSTVTAGIVSAKARNINILREQSQYPIESFIQTDAAVNRGNSGGALVNLNGDLIGINSAIISPSGSYSGYSFAVPVNLVKKVVTDIIKYGEVQRAVLGVSINNIDSEKADELNLSKIEGVLIADVTKDGAANEVGLKVNDVILEINSIKVNSSAELMEQIGKYHPGETINITINRNNKKKQFEVLLRNTLGTTKIIKTEEYLSILGASFKQIDANEKHVFGIKNGVKIIDLKNGALKQAGLKEGYVITHIENEKITQIDDIKEIINKKGKGAVVEFGAMYSGHKYIYVYRYKVKIE